MKKNLKITLIVIGIIVGVIILDSAQAIIFNNSPIIRITKKYSDFHKKNIGLFVETEIYEGVTQTTRFRWEESLEEIKDKKDDLNDSYQKIHKYFGNEEVDRSNLGAYSLDKENNIVVVTLIDNSIEKQNEFLNQTGANAKFIIFKQGGPYTTSSNFDFYIRKPQNYNSIKYNEYYKHNDRTIYLSSWKH